MKERPYPYRSATHGPIPLSAHGKRLMSKLRNAVVAALPTGSYDANRQAIAHARGELVLYISQLEGNNSMCTKTETVDHFTRPGNLFTELRQRVLDVSQTHGRERVLTLLRQYGIENLSSLKLSQAEAFSTSLERLALEPTGSEHALKLAVDTIATEYGSTFRHPAADRALFEAGREYQRNK